MMEYKIPTLRKIIRDLDYDYLRLIAKNLKIYGRSKMSEDELIDSIVNYLKNENNLLDILRNLPENAIRLLDIIRDHEGFVERRIMVQEYGMSYSTFRKYINELIDFGIVFYDDERDIYFTPKEVLYTLHMFVEEEESNMSFSDFLSKYLTSEQLKNICRKMNLPVSGKKQDIIDRIASSNINIKDVMQTLSIYELKDIAENMGLVKSGRKDEIIDRILEQLSISRIKRYNISQNKKSIKQMDVREKPKNKIDYLWNEIASYIEKNFHPVTYRKDMKERDLEMLLYSQLQGAFSIKGYKIEYEKLKKKSRLDLVVNDSIGIELKFRPSKSDYQRLIGQIEDYLDEYKRIIVVLAISPSSNPSTTEAYKTKLEAKGVKVIIKPV